MARTTKQIKKGITDSFISNPTIITAYGLDVAKTFDQEFSLVSLENIVFEIVAFAIWTLEKLFDIHKQEVEIALVNQKSGTLPWYRTKALAFQYGFDLLIDSDLFDNGTATQDQIQDSKIVKYAAVNESVNQSRVIVKIAGENTGVLSPISPEQQESFVAYINEVKYAGVPVTVVNYEPDKLYLNLVIYRDSLLIDSEGNSIKDGGKPVEDALNEYMKELPFNGELVLAHLIDKLQQVPGIKIPHLVSAQSSWIDVQSQDYGSPQPINVKVIPVSGYFTLVDFNNVSYVV